MDTKARPSHRCEACRHAFNSSENTKSKAAGSQYLFQSKLGGTQSIFLNKRTESSESNNSSNSKMSKMSKTRPSSGSSTKSVSPRGSSRASSEPRMLNADFETPKPKKRFSSAVMHSKTTAPKNKPADQNVEELKNDLSTIKQQLYSLTKNRNEALQVTNELQTRYIGLKRKSQEQDKIIEDLRHQNEKLRQHCKCQIVKDPKVGAEVQEVRKSLDQYEEKLNILYDELIDSSKVMVEAREKVCRCIEKSNESYKEFEHSKRELSQVAEEKNLKYQQLLESYQRLKETSEKYEQKNKELQQTVSILENKLRKAIQDMEQIRKVRFFFLNNF